MFVYLNIDVWKDKASDGIYIKGKPEGVDAEFVEAGTPIEHPDNKLFSRRIRDDKIIFGPGCLPEIDMKGKAWRWEGLASRKVLKKSPT